MDTPIIGFEEPDVVGFYSSTDTLDELHRKREFIALIITTEYPENVSPWPEKPGCLAGVYEIERDGARLAVSPGAGEFKGFSPGLVTSDHNTPAQRAKRRRHIRLTNLCRAYCNVTSAIACYKRLLADKSGPDPGLVEMLANTCVTFGQQYAQFEQWTMQQANVVGRGRKGGKTKRFDSPEAAKLFDNAVSFHGTNISAIVRFLNKSKPAEVRDYGRDSVKTELESRGLIEGK